HAVHQPSEIGGELLRLRSRQQHAEIERMQEPRLIDPLLLIDNHAMHEGDLPGRSAEIDAADLQPDHKGLAKGWPGIRLSCRHEDQAALAGQLCRSSAAKRSQANNAS